MKKIIISAAIACVSFNASHSMDNAWGTFKDALLGNSKAPRDFMQEIQETQSNASLSELRKLRKIAALYTELRNRNRGKETYEEFNRLAQEHRARADELEKQERLAREQEAIKKKRAEDEIEWLNQIKAARKDNSRPQIERVENIIGYYTKLATLFADEDEKLNLYQTNADMFRQKKAYLTVLEYYKKSSDKSEQLSLLRELARICDNPDRVNDHMAKAQMLEEEIKSAAYNDSYRLLADTKDTLSKARIHKLLASYAPDEAQSVAHRQKAEQLEIDAQKEQEQQVLILNRTARIVGLNAEISLVSGNTSISEFKRRDTLAGLLEQRGRLAKGVPYFEQECAGDLERALKLRRESIAYAPDETTRMAIIRSLQS